VRLSGALVDGVVLADGMRLHLGRTVLGVRARGGRNTIPLAQPGRFGDLVAESVAMRGAVALLQSFAPSDLAVLIEGETGTGKELAAQALHAASPRAGEELVVFDCGATQPTLVAAELFGHERGAFSGADQARAGLLEQADGGTLFLDEIGELPLEVQPAFLGALSRKSARRLGAARDFSFDVRIVAATHKNLAEEVRKKRFREDLFHRLAVGRVRLPPLRDRPEDLAPLVHRFATELGVAVTPEIVTTFAAYSWPGNVRELRNAVERLRLHPSAAPLEARAVEPEVWPTLQDARQKIIDEFERGYLERTLARAGGQVHLASTLAGVGRQHMTKLVARHQLRVRDLKGR
jgi:DNA-binding NtrC family response regulator